MKPIQRLQIVMVIIAMLALTIATPVAAFDGREGDRVVIDASEVVDDDLYVGAQEFVLDGTVNGDVLVFAQTITVNGTVDGDLFAGAQTVIVNGAVNGSVRGFGTVLFIGEKATIGGDIFGAGYSLEVRAGSVTRRDLVFAGGQALLAGDVSRNVTIASGALELRGTVGGDVTAAVGGADQSQMGPPPTMFMPQTAIPVPVVKVGLTIDPSARIEGDLNYTHSKELNFPAGVVGGDIVFSQAVASGGSAQRQPTTGEKVAGWVFDFMREGVSLLLVGLLLLWLFPAFMQALSANLRAKPLPSLGWGALTWVMFFVALFLIVFVTIAGAILFGVLTLGQLTGTVIWLGVLAAVVLIAGFVLFTTFVTKIAFGAALGQWLLTAAKSSLAENRYMPMVIGVLLTVVVIALFSFPLIPGALGGLLNFAVVLLGLGALWIWGRERMTRKPVS